MKRVTVSFGKFIPNHVYRQADLWNICFVSSDGEASLHMFVPRTPQVSFLLPETVQRDVQHVLLSPADTESSIEQFELEVEGHTTVMCARDEDLILFQPYVPPRPEVIQEGLASYADTKRSILRNTFALVLTGTAAASQWGGDESHAVATAFATGGAAGFLYQFLLQYELDRIGKNQFIINPATRLFVLALVFGNVATSDALHGSLLPFFLGFWMNKMALWLAFINKNEEEA